MSLPTITGLGTPYWVYLRLVMTRENVRIRPHDPISYSSTQGTTQRGRTSLRDSILNQPSPGRKRLRRCSKAIEFEGHVAKKSALVVHSRLSLSPLRQYPGRWSTVIRFSSIFGTRRGIGIVQKVARRLLWGRCIVEISVYLRPCRTNRHAPQLKVGQPLVV